VKVYVNVKQAGVRKNYITKQELILNSKPETLRELIAAVVSDNVKSFNNKIEGYRIIEYLTDEQIKDKLVRGRVSFGEVYNETMADVDMAIEAAILAYEDGIFRVFIGESEGAGLDEKISINEEETLIFVRLTMLTGRLW
jgi:ABC-type proline/glycine betaine transport system substrate-binding protein